MNSDLEKMTPSELGAELARLKSNQANRARESAARRAVLEREHPHLFDSHPNNQKHVLAELDADLDVAEQADAERMEALKAVLLARITAPVK